MPSVVDQLFSKQATPSAKTTTQPGGSQVTGSVVDSLFAKPKPTPTITTSQPVTPVSGGKPLISNPFVNPIISTPAVKQPPVGSPLSPFGGLIAPTPQTSQPKKSIFDNPLVKLGANTLVQMADQTAKALDFVSDYVIRSVIKPSGIDVIPGVSQKRDEWLKTFDEASVNSPTEKLKKATQKLTETPALQPSKEWQEASLKDKFSKKYIGETILNIAPSILSSASFFVIPPLGFAVSALSTASDVQSLAEQNGIQKDQAEKIGLGTGVVIGALDKIVPDEVFGGNAVKNKFLTSLAKKMFNLVKKTGLETATEVAQENIQLLVESTFRDDLGWDEVKIRNAMSAFGGALGGLGFGVIDNYLNTTVPEILSETPTTPQEEKKTISQALPPGEYAPQQILDKVLGTPAQSTNEGKNAIKEAYVALEEGRNVQVNEDGTFSIPEVKTTEIETTPPPQEQPKVETPKPEVPKVEETVTPEASITKEKATQTKEELTLAPSQAKTQEELLAEMEKTDAGFIKFGKDGVSYQTPAIGKPEIKVLLTDKELKANPVFTVTKEKALEFTGEKSNYLIKPEALQINPDRIKAGEKIRIDLQSLKKAGTNRQMRIYKGGEVQASIGDYATSIENITETTKEFKTIPFPEMVRLAEQLMKKVPTVKTPRARGIGVPRGYFAPGKNEIVLNPEIFKDAKQASFTLAHEMGHLTDFLPDKTMARGNILGRIATMRKFLRSTFSGVAEEKRVDELLRRRETLRSERKATKNEAGEVVDKAKNSDLLKRIKAVNKEIKEIRSKGAIKDAEIRKELWDLSKKWRPIGENPSAEFLAYRKQPEELYADAISVLFNDPVRLKQEAPKFFESFFKYLDQKPEVKKDFFELQDLLNKSDEEVMNERLKDLEKDYTEGEKTWLAKETEARNQKENLVNILSTAFNDVNTPVNRRVNEYIKKGGIVDPSFNPIYDRSGLNYLEGKVKNFVVDNYQPALTIAKDVPNGWSELGKILQLERAIYERGELANPRGYNPEEAQKTLDALEKKVGEKDWVKLQRAKEQFRSATQSLIAEAEKAGFYRPELIDQMKANPAYATFQVLDYLDTRVSSSVMRQKGTLKGIANPATSTVMKAVTTLRAIRYNQSRKVNIDFLQTAYPDEISPAKSRFTGRRKEFIPPRDRDLDLVTVIKNGKQEGYYVPKEVGDVLNFSSDNTLRTLGRIAKKFTKSGFYRNIFTTFNLGFQLFNVQKDFSRTWRNLPDANVLEASTSFFKILGAYKRAVKPSLNRALGRPDAIIKELENNELLGLTRNDLYGTPDPGDEQITRELQKVGALPVEEQKSYFQKITKPINMLFDGISVIGDTIETMPKVAGYDLLKGKMPTEELTYFIRNYIGSPDFRVSGKATPITNNIFLFSNAIKEGVKGDLNMAFKKTDTRSVWWYKMALGTVVPKFLQIAIAGGLFGELMKKLMDGVSEYDKTNYDIIILGQDENGKTIYIRKPKDESGRFVGALVWKFANTLSAKNKQKLLEDLADIFSLWSGQLPSFAPSITGFQATLAYLSGKNPYDPFRNRFVIPETQFKAGFKYSFPIFLDWLSKNQGLNVITPSYTPQGQVSQLEKILNWPILSNILGRFIKVSDYGIVEQSNEVQKQIEQESAIKSAEKKLKVQKAIDTFVKQKDQSLEARQKAIDELVVDVLGHEISSKDENTTAKDIAKRFGVGILTNKYNASVDNILTANTNQEKAQGLKYLYENDRETYDQINQTLIDEGIVTKDTFEKFQQLIEEDQNKKTSFNIVTQAIASDEGIKLTQEQRTRLDEINMEIEGWNKILFRRSKSKLISPQPDSVISDKINALWAEGRKILSGESDKPIKKFEYPDIKMTPYEQRTAETFDNYEIPRSVIFGMAQAEGGKIGNNNVLNIGAYDSDPSKAIHYPSLEANATASAKLLSGTFTKSNGKVDSRYKEAWDNRKDPVKMLKLIEKAGFAGDPKTWKERSIAQDPNNGAGLYYDSWSEFIMDTQGWKRWFSSKDNKKTAKKVDWTVTYR